MRPMPWMSPRLATATKGSPGSIDRLWLHGAGGGGGMARSCWMDQELGRSFTSRITLFFLSKMFGSRMMGRRQSGIC